MQCCGEPFVVGSHVTWTLIEVAHEAFAPLLDARHSPTITHREDHHGGGSEDAPQTGGEVRAIQVLRCSYATTNGSQGRTQRPLAGTTELTVTSAATGREAEAPPQRFVAYVVSLLPD